MKSDGNAIDTLLKKAFTRKAKRDSGVDGILLGRLTDFAALFPAHKSNTLRMLAGLSVRVKKSDQPHFFLNVMVGHGQEFATANKLHEFFSGMIESESEKEYLGFIKHGHSLVVTAGHEPRSIVAAASFTGRSDGIYVAAMAVSHGKHKDSCVVPQKALLNFREDQTKHKTSLKEGDFQGLGLGALLLVLLSGMARLVCVEEAAIYLKAHFEKKEYYIRRGFVPSELISSNIHDAIPAFYRKVDEHTLMMVLMLVKSSDEAAAVDGMFELNSSEPMSTAAHAAQPSGEDVKSDDDDDNESAAPPPSVDGSEGDKKPRAVDRPREVASPSKSAKRRRKAQEKKKKAKAKADAALALKAKEDDDSILDSEEEVNIASDAKRDSKKRKQSNARRGSGQTAVAVEVASSEDDEDDDAEDDDDEDDDSSPPTPEHIPRTETLAHDWWKPQERAYEKFKAEAPVRSHQMTQKELCAEYHDSSLPILSRKKVLELALQYKVDTNFMQSSRLAANYNVDFTDQEYVDLAAVCDLNRPIEIHHSKYIKAHQEVEVHVSSYKISKSVTLETLLSDERRRKKMKPEVRDFKVSLSFLLSSTRPEVAEMIEETLHGTKVQSLPGPTDGSDAFSLSYGKLEHVQKYVPLPQGHVYTAFAPIAPPTVPWSRPAKKGNAPGAVTRKSERSAALHNPDLYYDKTGRATLLLHQHMKEEARARKIPFMPPPPHDQTQVVKLKWIRSPGTTREGLWHGVYATQLGVGKSHTILQECGLLTDWVESTFAAPFRKECKDVASGKDGARNPKQFLYIPAGDSHDSVSDPPPSTEVLSEARTMYLQGDEDTCLRDSLASALSAMGLGAEAKIVAMDSELIGRSLDLVSTAAKSVKISCAAVNLVMKRVHGCSIAAIALLDSAWPIILLFQTSDGCYGSHAATTWNGMIFDANCPNPLRWSQKSLDWCSGPGSACIGFSRAYRICPRNYEELPTDWLSPSEGSWLRPREGGMSGWIWRMPAGKWRKYIVRYPSGVTESMSKEEVVALCAPRSKVGSITF